MSQSAPINPKKAWTVTLAIALIILTIFGSFILKNLLTLALIVIPIASWYFGSQNQVKNLRWVVAIIIAIELLVVATGTLEPLQRRLDSFGGIIQCLSGLGLVGWVVYAFRDHIARKLDIPEGTGQSMLEEAKKLIEEINDWLRK